MFFFVYFHHSGYDDDILFTITSIFCRLYQETVSVLCNICLTWLYCIKLGLTKFVTTLNRKVEPYAGIYAMFLKLSDSNVVTGVFVVEQVKQMLEMKMIEKSWDKRRQQATYLMYLCDWIAEPGMGRSLSNGRKNCEGSQWIGSFGEP